jgi:hypothetical protein
MNSGANGAAAVAPIWPVWDAGKLNGCGVAE